MEILNYFYFTWATTVNVFDVHPIRLGVNYPDFFDNYSSAAAQADQYICMGANFDANVLSIKTNFLINFKKMDVSLLDVFQFGDDVITGDLHGVSGGNTDSHDPAMAGDADQPATDDANGDDNGDEYGDEYGDENGDENGDESAAVDTAAEQDDGVWTQDDF